MSTSPTSGDSEKSDAPTGTGETLVPTSASQPAQPTLQKGDMERIQSTIKDLQDVCTKLRVVSNRINKEDLTEFNNVCKNIQGISKSNEPGNLSVLTTNYETLKKIVDKYTPSIPTSTPPSATPTTSPKNIEPTLEVYSPQRDDLMRRIADLPPRLDTTNLGITRESKVILVKTSKECFDIQQTQSGIDLKSGIVIFTNDKGAITSFKRFVGVGSTTSKDMKEVTVYTLNDANDLVKNQQIIETPIGTLVFCYNETSKKIENVYLKIGESGKNEFLKLNEVVKVEKDMEPQHIVVRSVGQFIISGVLFNKTL